MTARFVKLGTIVGILEPCPPAFSFGWLSYRFVAPLYRITRVLVDARLGASILIFSVPNEVLVIVPYIIIIVIKIIIDGPPCPTGSNVAVGR